MFNLGYLPNSDKSVITHAESTISALEQLLPVLAPHGIISVMAYSGHEGGEQELNKLQKWLSSLDQGRYWVERHQAITRHQSPPVLFMLGQKWPVLGKAGNILKTDNR